MDSFTKDAMELMDLPVEILEIIFDYLTVPDLKNASMVCLQWSNMAFSGRRMHRVLTLDGWLRSIVFEDCKPLSALQELRLHSIAMDHTLECFKKLSTMMPNLRKLDVIEQDMDDDCLHFICKNMVSLQQMLLEICPNITEDGFEYLNRLPHLFELSLGYLDLLQGFLVLIPPNEVKLLSLNRCDKLTDDDLMLIPHVFPLLTRLKIASCHLITFAGIERLRSQIPWCTVITEHILE
ncbi:F-box/LRR-repeat protein fbxl-1-like isoform X2 [Anopheles coustani]|uniref:F-box/LRR-repeat protein fbxl-1-like isoform X2 n=1 Tax=Anopheles coustani TaxID=139045 RepID=UPI002658934C|nr:F-box/LRR-repeat protein fbxl-1-like isoform X2 [Anopheles coustani]